MRFCGSEAVADTPTRDVDITCEPASSPAVSTETRRTARSVRQTWSMADGDAHDASDGRLGARRYAVAAQRRRLLTHALHSGVVTEAIVCEHATTGRFVRISSADLEAAGVVPAASQRAARGTLAPSGIAASATPAPPIVASGLGERVGQLRIQAAACRAKAIALNAKLGLLEADHAQLCGASGEVHAMREQLAEGSARLDHAIDEIDAVTAVERQLSLLR